MARPAVGQRATSLRGPSNASLTEREGQEPIFCEGVPQDVRDLIRGPWDVAVGEPPETKHECLEGEPGSRPTLHATASQ